jgi:hypothetical protein
VVMESGRSSTRQHTKQWQYLSDVSYGFGNNSDTIM